jgi:replicative DNA helicase
VAANVASPEQLSVPGPGDDGYGDTETERPGYGVAVFSLEMPKEQVAARLVCCEARVDLGKLRQGYLSQDDWANLTSAASVLANLPIWIDDTPALGILELRAKIRRLKADYNRVHGSDGPGLGAVIIDYLQLMSGRKGVTSREQEISEISRGLKQIAKEMSVPVIALSQLNRGVETRGGKDKRPMLSDLRESGAIEQDADVIVFIYRDEYYNKEETNERGIAELIIAKQRNGPTGTVRVRFVSSCTKFENLAPGEYEEFGELG